MEREAGGDLDAADAITGEIQRRGDLEGHTEHTRSTAGDRDRTAGALFSCGRR